MGEERRVELTDSRHRVMMKTEKKKSKQDEICSSDKRIRSKDLSDLKTSRKEGVGEGFGG